MLMGRSWRRASRGSSASLRVGLLRHGEVEGGSRFRGHTDDPLTATGLTQMHAAIADSSDWDKVISSPLARCAAFAEEYARRYSTPLSFDARLVEMHFGAWEGRSAAELMETGAGALARFWADPLNNPPPGGEPLVQFQTRVLDAWHDIIMDDAGPSTLVVTHGGAIRVLLCHVQRRPIGELLALEVEPATLHHIRAARSRRSRGRARATVVSGKGA